MYCASHVVEAHICPWLVPCVSLFFFAFSGLKSTGYMNGWRQNLPVHAAPDSHYERLPAFCKEPTLISQERAATVCHLQTIWQVCAAIAHCTYWIRSLTEALPHPYAWMSAGAWVLCEVYYCFCNTFSGTWMACFYLSVLTLSGLLKRYSPGQSSGSSCFRGKGGGITSFLCSVACRSVSRCAHLNLVFLEGPRVLILLQSSYDMTVIWGCWFWITVFHLFWGNVIYDFLVWRKYWEILFPEGMFSSQFLETCPSRQVVTHTHPCISILLAISISRKLFVRHVLKFLWNLRERFQSLLITPASHSYENQEFEKVVLPTRLCISKWQILQLESCVRNDLTKV